MEISIKKIILLIQLACAAYSINAQKYLSDTLQAHTNYDNVHARAIYHDSLTSHFAIWVKLKVKEHKHEYHTEQIIVLEGKGEFKLADSTFTIKKGDIIIVPQNTYHAVETSSKKPLKVISIQAPYFDGSDRVFKPIPE
jgi:mannose-6-phosphate isomerase-like protein (cupin superfamily)